MRNLILLVLLGSAFATVQATASQLSEEKEMKVSILSAQTEQAGDVRPNRGGGRRRVADDMPVVGESFFDASMM